ncbi:MAG: hypothetical protein N0C86_20225 [Candidatus Thiodiazotropha taylori]|nr:hypothetical protein [Candidatus Thiodiazotropha taylori]MCW4328327.1 hypothetical protein [Candidatus Thiodiazotropha taylori]
MRKILFIFYLMGVTNIVDAANIYAGRNATGFYEVKIEGRIVKGDYDKAALVSHEIISSSNYQQNYLRTGIRLNFNLNSKGGDVIEAMRIGKLVRRLLATASVLGSIIREDDGYISNHKLQHPENAFMWQDNLTLRINDELTEEHLVKCYSSCVFIFFGATSRIVRDNVDQRDGYLDDRNAIPVMGIHRPYYEKDYFSSLDPMEAQEKYKDLFEVTRSYLIDMGASLSLVERMFKKSSEEIELIKAPMFKEYYSEKEAFYEEWLISKCGTSDAAQILSKREFKLYQQIENLRRDEFMRCYQKGEDYKAVYENDYTPEGFDKEIINAIYSKYYAHSRNVANCHKRTIYEHQTQWANAYK